MSAPVSHDPLVVNTKDGAVWRRRAVTEDGRGLYAADGTCACPEFLLVPLSELAVHGIVESADVLPVPVGPQQPPFPPTPRSFEEKLGQDVARLQGLLAEAVRDAHRARSERDLIRERVSEPFGCSLCGVEKRSHGRRYIGGEMHAWVRPSDEQVKSRMLARRAARFTSHTERLAQLLVARTEDLLVAEARIAELEAERSEVAAEINRFGFYGSALPVAKALVKRADELVTENAALKAERHSTNEALDDAVQELRARQSCPCPPPLDPAPHQVGCPQVVLPLPGLREVLDGEHFATVHHDYRVGHDLPETGGSR